MSKPKVLITVTGGIAEYSIIGDVDVEMIDYDCVSQGDLQELSPEFAAAFPADQAQLIKRTNEIGAWEITK